MRANLPAQPPSAGTAAVRSPGWLRVRHRGLGWGWKEAFLMENPSTLPV